MKTQTKQIGRLKALELIKNSKGCFFGVIFKKQDGTERVMNAQYTSSLVPSELGYVRLKDRNDNFQIKNVNLQTISKITLKGITYKVR